MATIRQADARTRWTGLVHKLLWIRNDHSGTAPGTIDIDAIRRLAETSEHLLDDIGLRSDDPRFQPQDPADRSWAGR